MLLSYVPVEQNAACTPAQRNARETLKEQEVEGSVHVRLASTLGREEG